MATKLMMDHSHVDQIIAARTAWDSKGARKAAWARIRQDLGVPSGIRLKAEVDDRDSADYRVLKNADTNEYLWRLDDGSVVCSRTTPDEPVCSRTTPDESQVAQTGPVEGGATNGRFAKAQGDTDGVIMCIDLDDLVDALRGDCMEGVDDHAYRPRSLPAGFPGVTGNGVVLDTTDRKLYFAA